MLDETMEVLTAAWSGEPVHHRGEHYTVDGIRFPPRPVQRPRVPVWVAGYPGRARPMRRAARHDGFFPIDLDHPDQLAEIAATLTDLRGPATPYDITVALPPGTDPAPYITAGATWWMPEISPGTTLDQVQGVVRDGPYKPEERHP
ncbi:LLM class flavin-dependent oxidoreductase [Spirillospora sp. NBC_00431]